MTETVCLQWIAEKPRTEEVQLLKKQKMPFPRSCNQKRPVREHARKQSKLNISATPEGVKIFYKLSVSYELCSTITLASREGGNENKENKTKKQPSPLSELLVLPYKTLCFLHTVTFLHCTKREQQSDTIVKS